MFCSGHWVEDEISEGRSVEEGCVEEGTVEAALSRRDDAALELFFPVEPETSVPPLPLLKKAVSVNLYSQSPFMYVPIRCVCA